MNSKLAWISVVLIAGLGGCVRREVVYVQGPPPPGTVVYQEAEPAPIVEVVPEPPTVGVIWVPGVWFYDHHRWVWHRGHWRH